MQNPNANDLSEQQRYELAMQGEQLEYRLRYLRGELERITMILIELEKAKASLSGIIPNKDALVPIGSDILAECKIIKQDVFFPVGSGYYMMMKPADATKKLETSLEKIKEAYKRINEDVKNSETHLIELLKKVQEYG